MTDVFARMPTLQTPRLILRRIAEDDAADLFAVFGDPAVTAHYDLETMADIDEAYELIDYFDESFEVERQVRWGICRREDDRLLGTCGFVALYEHRAEIGYELGSAYWRQGYMTEALEALIEYGFERLELNRIEALVMPENRRSAALLEHLGFRNEGTLRDYDYFKGAFQDMCCFALLRREYHVKRHGA